MRLVTLSRCEEDFTHERPSDVARVHRNLDPVLHPLRRATEATRALSAAKLSRVFAKPFLGALDGHADGVTCLARSRRDAASLVSGAADGQILIWDVPSRRAVASLRAHSRAVRGVVCTPDGTGVLSCGDDAAVRFWRTPDAQGGTTLAAAASGGGVDQVAPAASFFSKHVFSDLDHHWRRPLFATAGAAVELWDPSRSEPVSCHAWGSDTVVAVRFNPSEADVFASCGSDRSVALYDVRAGTPLRKLVMLKRANKVTWNPQEAFNFVLASEDNHLYSFDMRRLDAASCVHKDFVSAVTDVDFSPTGREFVASSYDRSIRIFAYNSGHSREVYHTKRMQRCGWLSPTLVKCLLRCFPQ